MAHPDLEELLGMLYGFAQEMLRKHGEFFPFGAVMKVDGELVGVQGHTGEEQPPSQDVIDLLQASLKDQAAKDEIRAAGICLDVMVTPPGSNEKTDALCARLEHKTGEAVEVYLPYRRGWFGRMKYGEIFAGSGEKTIF